MKETPIDNPKTMKLLINPIRYAIWIAVIKLGPATVKEIGELICKDPGALYRHVDKLEKSGLIKQHGKLTTKGRKAVSYITDPNPYLVYDPGNPENIDVMASVCENAARQAASQNRKALENGQAVTRSPTRNTFLKADSFWVNDAELRTINNKIDELRALLINKHTPDGRRLVHLTVIMRPNA